MEGDCFVVASSITITEELAWKLHAYGRNVSLQGQDSVSPTLSSVSAVSAAIRFVCSSHICCGNTDEKFLPLVQARKGKFMDASGTIVMFAVIFTDSDSQIKFYGHNSSCTLMLMYCNILVYVCVLIMQMVHSLLTLIVNEWAHCNCSDCCMLLPGVQTWSMLLR